MVPQNTARFDTAFSRDQTEKIYVQNRMVENGAELFAWLEDGGHFYVCGDATRMAKDYVNVYRSLLASSKARDEERDTQLLLANGKGANSLRPHIA